MTRAAQVPVTGGETGVRSERPHGVAVPALQIRDLTVAYGEKPVLRSLSAAFAPGSMAAIIGPNGAGKSTLIKAALGIVPRLTGTVDVFGVPLAEARQRIAYVPQRASVDWDFPARVCDVVGMGLYPELGLLRRLTAAHSARIADALDKVAMSEFAERQIGELSGGQAQRVFLARALVREADIFLLDEPFAGVDAATEAAIIAVLKRLRSGGKTVIAVHHDLSTVADYFDHVLLVNGQAVAAGSVASTLTRDNLHKTYGGRLAALQIDDLALAAPAAVPQITATPATGGG